MVVAFGNNVWPPVLSLNQDNVMFTIETAVETFEQTLFSTNDDSDGQTLVPDATVNTLRKHIFIQHKSYKTSQRALKGGSTGNRMNCLSKTVCKSF